MSYSLGMLLERSLPIMLHSGTFQTDCNTSVWPAAHRADQFEVSPKMEFGSKNRLYIVQ